MQGELQTARECIAVDHRDRRVPGAFDALQDRDHRGVAVCGRALTRLHLAQVHAGAEGRTRAAKNDDPDVGAPVERVEAVTEGREQRRVHRVALVRAVERDGRDPVGHGREDLVGHAAPMVSSPRMAVFPGFTLPEELRALRTQVRRFIQDEIIPLEQRLDPDAPELPAEDWKRLAAKTKAAGLWALGAPEEYGGGGLDTFSMCVVLEEMAQHRMGLYNSGCGVFGRYPPPAIWAGSKAQIEKYAVPTLREGWETFFAITEPAGGSDPAGAIQTRAEKRGDHWVLNGRKVFISRAHDAPWGVVFARTDTTKGRDGISCFIVERGTPGFSARNIRTIRTSAVPNDVVFEDCELPAENLVGAPGQGLDLAFDLLVKNRFPYSACNLGVAVAAHRMAIAHAKQRSTFGAPLAQRQAIQWMLADAEVEIRAARWLIWEGAWKADRGEDARVEASIAKLYSSEVLGRVVDAAVQIHGGYGVSKEFPLERWYREGRVRRIGEGPSEVHRMVIARSLFR